MERKWIIRQQINSLSRQERGLEGEGSHPFIRIRVFRWPESGLPPEIIAGLTKHSDNNRQLNKILLYINGIGSREP